jgi:hypothetical protein
MTTPSGAALAPAATSAGRPQPQTTAEPQGGPFIRHAPPGRRPIYQQPANFGLFFGPPMVSSPGWNRGYRLKIYPTANGSSGGVLQATGAFADIPFSIAQLLQLKDAWGTNLMAGPGWEMLFLVQLLSGQFGLDFTRSPQNLPSWTGVTAGTGAFKMASYLPFEFTKGYGLISGANAALLPVLQMTIAASSVFFSTPPTGYGTGVNISCESDYYWLPNVPVDPPGIGTTCQYIFQPCNPVITSGSSLRVQLPRLGGYLTTVGLDLRDSTNARLDAWPTAAATGATSGRLQIYQDGVPLIDTDMDTFYDDLAIQTDIGSGYGGTQTAAPTLTAMPRPAGIIFINRKTALAQRDFGLFDTGETFLSTNPGTQLEIGGSPFGTISNTPATLNAVIGQVVPTGPLVQGLPEI